MMQERDELLQMYLDELEEIPELSDQEQEKLISLKLSGDKQADKRLVEGNLKYAMTVLSKHIGMGLSVQEMISIANLELVRIIDNYRSGDLKTAISDGISKTLADAISQEKQVSNGMDDVTARVNVLMEVTERMADELGRQATVTELAHKMNATEDEIQELIKMSINAMNGDNSINI